MNLEESDLWYAVAEKFIGGTDLVEKKFELDKFLGVTEFYDYFNRPGVYDTPMSPKLKALLEGFLGPHGHALMKAYRIKKGLES